MQTVATFEPLIVAIPRWAVDLYWSAFLPLIRNTVSSYEVVKAAEGIRHLARGGQRQLFISTDGQIGATCVLAGPGPTCQVFPMFAPVLKGTVEQRLGPLLAAAEMWARESGCDSMEAHYAFMREPDPHGWRQTYEILSKDLRGKLS